GLRTLRFRPAAPGGDPARQQGGHPRGARPAHGACRARAQADCRRRRDRPPARLSGAGAQPRIEYSDRQVERRRTHQYRARSQDRGRAIPRAGAEPGMSQNGDITRRGIMLVLSSPSGAGKTTLTRNLLEQEDNVSLSISVTTRERRPSEIDKVHYHFVTNRRFESLRDGGDLLEWAEVHGNYYGTPREPVETALAAGRDVL